MIPNIAYLSDPTETFALDTSKPQNGAPGLPGTLRFHMHPTYGFQIYRLVLNESTASLTVGKHYINGAGSAYAPAISGEGVAASTVKSLLGVAVVAAADDYWTWLLVYGRGLILAGGTTITGTDTVELDAAGAFLDGTAGAGTVVGAGLGSGADITNATTGAAFINML